MALFFLEFEAGAEVVLEGAPESVVDVIHQGHEFRLVDAIIAEQWSGMGPVFLLDMGVIVFPIGS